MSIINVKKSTLNKFDPVKEKMWRAVECLNVEGPKAAASGKSQNYVGTFKVLSPEDDEGKEVRYYFNDSEMGQVEIIRAVAGAEGFSNPEEMFTEGEELAIDISNLKGKQLEAQIGPEPYNGKITNSIFDFRAISTQEVPFK